MDWRGKNLGIGRHTLHLHSGRWGAVPIGMHSVESLRPATRVALPVASAAAALAPREGLGLSPGPCAELGLSPGLPGGLNAGESNTTALGQCYPMCARAVAQTRCSSESARPCTPRPCAGAS